MKFSPNLGHIGLFCKDLDAMVEFYTKNFGMIISDSGDGESGKARTVRRGYFLTSDPEEHHQLVLIEGRGEDTPPTTAQISFLIPSLDELRAFYHHVKANDIPIEIVKNHGNAWSIYILDPDGNMLEIYANADYYVSQPITVLMDLDWTNEEILAQTEEIVKADPSWRPRSEWVKEQAEKIEAAKLELK